MNLPKLNKKIVSDFVNYMYDQESIRKSIEKDYGLSKSEFKHCLINSNSWLQLLVIENYIDQVKESLSKENNWKPSVEVSV